MPPHSPSVMSEQRVAAALRIQHKRGSERVHTVRLAGELDYSTAADLRAVLSAVLATRPLPAVVEIDLSRLTFVDSTGLGTLVVGYRICADIGVRLAVRDPSPFVSALLDVAGVQTRLVDATSSEAAPS